VKVALEPKSQQKKSKEKAQSHRQRDRAGREKRKKKKEEEEEEEGRGARHLNQKPFLLSPLCKLFESTYQLNHHLSSRLFHLQRRSPILLSPATHYGVHHHFY
jgi:hypothetical protein